MYSSMVSKLSSAVRFLYVLLGVSFINQWECICLYTSITSSRIDCIVVIDHSSNQSLLSEKKGTLISNLINLNLFVICHAVVSALYFLIALHIWVLQGLKLQGNYVRNHWNCIDFLYNESYIHALVWEICIESKKCNFAHI